MIAALRAMKMSIELLAGQRPGQSFGAPMIYVQTTEPAQTSNLVFKTGDLWIKPQDSTMAYWNGKQWVKVTV